MAKTTSILTTLNELRRLTTGELREKYQKVFGEATSSRNKEYLFKKIAAALQERKKSAPPARGENAAPRQEPAPGASGTRDPRLPPPGTVLRREFEGKTFEVTVLDDGFEFRGERRRSLSTIAKEISGTAWNGFLFWHLQPYAKRTRTAA